MHSIENKEKQSYFRKKTLILDMQIQICAEYQGMLPRLRLVCQVYLTNAAEAWVACPVILHRF